MVETAQDIYSLLSNPYALLILAFILDLCIGDPKWLPHPVRIMGWAISKTEKILRKWGVGKKKWEVIEKFKGILLVVIIVCVTLWLTWFITYFLLLMNTSYFLLLTSYLLLVYLISTTISVKGLIDSAGLVIGSLRDKDLLGARTRLSNIVGRDTDSLDEKSILKATVESLAENASDGIIAPLFYFAIGGLPLAMTYKAINTMDSMVGYKNDKYRHFGWAAARLDDVANYIPARITGILIVMASSILNWSLVTGHWSLKIMFRDGRNHPSPNSGVPEAAIAGSLGVRLGGPSKYAGVTVDKSFIGMERVKDYLSASEEAINIVRVASLLALWIAMVILYVRGLT
ncbi:MAG: cobalamin biosynthesis protein CobD [Nitrospirae bacterium]|nr:cobalamin biosynthesis protein CobD [Nitrospirota bacterium]